MHTSLLETKVPRYTSYPPASSWGTLDSKAYENSLLSVKETSLSLYVHIPFCSSLCYYCGCTTYLNHNAQLEELYIKTLFLELQLLKEKLSCHTTHEVHFGGGSPSKLSISQLKTILDAINTNFPFEHEAAISIEVDPRTISQNPFHYLSELQKLGCTRISFGVQDLDANVQKAIGRNQTKEETFAAIEAAKKLRFKSIALDLVYGLPLQTKQSFQTTIREIISLRPEKLSLFSFAYLPEMKPNQKAIDPTLLPATQDKFSLFYHAKEQLLAAGYLSIGLDHFVLPEDELGKAFIEKTISRNFQGYVPHTASTTLGIGASSIGFLNNGYYQNTKNLDSYIFSIQKGIFATDRGIILSQEDIVRAFVIESIMCYGMISKDVFEKKTSLSFDTYFHKELAILENKVPNLFKNTDISLEATPLGFFFLRNLAACFDNRYDTFLPASQG